MVRSPQEECTSRKEKRWKISGKFAKSNFRNIRQPTITSQLVKTKFNAKLEGAAKKVALLLQ
jgi:hypothetical protein